MVHVVGSSSCTVHRIIVVVVVVVVVLLLIIPSSSVSAFGTKQELTATSFASSSSKRRQYYQGLTLPSTTCSSTTHRHRHRHRIWLITGYNKRDRIMSPVFMSSGKAPAAEAEADNNDPLITAIATATPPPSKKDNDDEISEESIEVVENKVATIRIEGPDASGIVSVSLSFFFTRNLSNNVLLCTFFLKFEFLFFFIYATYPHVT